MSTRTSRNGKVARAARAARIGVILDELYPTPPIPLEHADPFTLLVAVMLSAQFAQDFAAIR